MFFLPQPAVVNIENGNYKLPQEIVLKVPKQDADVVNIIVQSEASGTIKKRIKLKIYTGKGWSAIIGSASPQTAPKDKEAYRLVVSKTGIALAASDKAGFRQGVRTLLQLLASGNTVPVCKIEDKPAIPMRGIMIDMARMKERDEIYFRLLEEMAAWKMNVLFLHFNDKEGCSIELRSHPEVVTAHAMSQATLKKLIARGNELGVRIIPEVEAWGHASWITRPHPELAEGDSTSLCPSTEATYTLLDDIIKEVAGLFPDPLMHIGCDEAYYLKDDACKKRAKEVGQDRLIADHINRVNQIARKYGKTSIIWADIVLKYEGVLKLLDKNIVAEDWEYSKTVTPEALHRLKNMGFTTWACPSLMFGGWRVGAANDTLENVRLFSLHAKNEGAEGVVTSIWLPQRYISDNLGPGIAWAADQAWNPGGHDIKDMMPAYMFHRFGLNPSLARVNRMMAMGIVGQRDGGVGYGFWVDSAALLIHDTPEGIGLDEEYSNAVRGIAKGFESDLKDVKSHKDSFESLAVTAAAGEHLALRRNTAQKVITSIKEASSFLEKGEQDAARTELQGAAQAIRQMETEREELYTWMLKIWDRDRYVDDPIRNGEGRDNLYKWFGSTETHGYANDLADRLDLLAQNPTHEELELLLK